MRENFPDEAGSHKICQDSPDLRLDVLFNFEIYDSKKKRKSKYFIFSQSQILYTYICFSSQFYFCQNFPPPSSTFSPYFNVYFFSNLFLLNFAAPLRFSSLFLGLFTRELGGQSASYPSLHPQNWKICGTTHSKKERNIAEIFVI